MASSDLAARSAPPRIPKLAYRNRVPDDQTSFSSAVTSGSETQSTLRPLDHHSSTSTSTSTSSPIRSSFDTRNVTSPNLASDVSTESPPKIQKKKKTNPVLGFLTLKEPSQSAFEHFAEQQRKQAVEKGGKRSPVGLPGISPQKLPSKVPKVNSKWDGVPESQKTRGSMARKRDSALTHVHKRLSGVADGSIFSFSSDDSHNPPNSLASSANSISHVQRNSSLSSSTSSAENQRKDSGPSVTTPEKAYVAMSSPSTASLPEITYFFPDNPNPSGILPGSSQKIATQNPPLAPSTIETDANRPKPIHIQALDGFVDDNLAKSPTLAEPPAHNSKADMRAIFKRVSKAQVFLAGEAQEVKVPIEDRDNSSDENQDFACSEEPATDPIQEPILTDKMEANMYSQIQGTEPPVNAAAEHLRPRTTNFSRPLSSQSLPMVPDPSRLSIATTTNRLSTPGLPTVYEGSSSNDTIGDLPDPGESSKPRSRQNSDATSIASSVTPSEMSASWYRSPRERLGLGGRIRKSDALPWESQEVPSPGKKKKGPLSVFARSNA
ncbi:hypothetical protein K469DRAFT_628857 [Zopfia rhizophila CBS 207.26]|uniref:Uncharacterized protein n=1 Tax=Zopfia rhizophila CBS 207.26 TaxID=1314779 RepID=A0A6A6EB95_9PEZI|nr:hypothetical protein K469DRAFT_628857 [Zopfia rhizophila CBS 207.26]